ncbi:YchJ family protein [Nocardioides sp.]|uniref:YchJ family protein n=1 Tax=Nocardioides sp. TaxID=35761 RepID=UPI002736C092|nr:YchJ family protein [Nocardioides sp.]MDP3891540.1 YchJ family protein [Nocardioides sp.]
MSIRGFGTTCPCGGVPPYAACCGRLHRQESRAETAEELMRSRYAAYAVGETDHVFRTWHPRTRPPEVTPHAELTWTGLEILDTVAGGPDDEEGVVEFRAHFTGPDGPGVLHERSRFLRRAGRWVYLDGDLS